MQVLVRKKKKLNIELGNIYTNPGTQEAKAGTSEV